MSPQRDAPPLGMTLGTGGVSVFATQFAKALGLEVIATTSDESKSKRLEAMRVNKVVDYKKTPEWDKEVLAINGGRHVDHVIEVGGSGTLQRSLNVIKTGGTVSLIGVLSGLGSMINPDVVLFKNVRLQGISIGSVRMFENMNTMIGKHQIKPILDDVYPFAEAHEAYARLEAAAHFGKIVITVEQ